jgi:hypothetical protein
MMFPNRLAPGTDVPPSTAGHGSLFEQAGVTGIANRFQAFGHLSSSAVLTAAGFLSDVFLIFADGSALAHGFLIPVPENPTTRLLKVCW